MVMRNYLRKTDGNLYIDPNHPPKRPRKFAFKIGDYDVAVHKKRFSRNWPADYHIAVWHAKTKIGSIDLHPSFSDIKTVFGVDARIDQNYQGLGIGYYLYEGLITQGNMGIASANQSAGAVKLWKKLASNHRLSLFFVSYTNKMFSTDIFNVIKRDNKLVGFDYEGKAFDPYKQRGSLMLVKRDGKLDQTIQEYMCMRREANKLLVGFRRYDTVRI